MVRRRWKNKIFHLAAEIGDEYYGRTHKFQLCFSFINYDYLIPRCSQLCKENPINYDLCYLRKKKNIFKFKYLFVAIQFPSIFFHFNAMSINEMTPKPNDFKLKMCGKMTFQKTLMLRKGEDRIRKIAL